MSAPRFTAAAECGDCGEAIDIADAEHAAEHAGRCCDCFDLSCGMPLDQLNAERRERGRRPLKAKVPR